MRVTIKDVFMCPSRTPTAETSIQTSCCPWGHSDPTMICKQGLKIVVMAWTEVGLKS